MNSPCKQPREDLLAYVETVEFGLDGATPEQCAEIAAHLEACEVCRHETQQITASCHRIREAPSPQVPANLGVLVTEAVRRSRAKRSFLPVPALAYTSLAVILLAGAVFLGDRDSVDEAAVPSQTARLSQLLDEQERWILILAHTLEESQKAELQQAGSYVLSRLDRSTQAFREGMEGGGLDPERVPEYEQTVHQQIGLLKEFYFEASSS